MVEMQSTQSRDLAEKELKRLNDAIGGLEGRLATAKGEMDELRRQLEKKEENGALKLKPSKQLEEDDKSFKSMLELLEPKTLTEATRLKSKLERFHSEIILISRQVKEFVAMREELLDRMSSEDELRILGSRSSLEESQGAVTDASDSSSSVDAPVNLTDDMLGGRRSLTLKGELELQSLLSASGKLSKDVKKKRLERLPQIQMGTINTLLITITKDCPMTTAEKRKYLAGAREFALTSIAENNELDASKAVWELAMMKQLLHMPMEQIAQSMSDTYKDCNYHDSKGLADFLTTVPHFREGFNAANRGKMTEYIAQSIDPELGLIKIGLKGSDGKVEWHHVSPEYASLRAITKRGAATKEYRSVAFAFGHRRLFAKDMAKPPIDLGIKDGDIITFSPRQSASVERLAAKKIRDEPERMPLQLLQGSAKILAPGQKGNSKGTKPMQRKAAYLQLESKEDMDYQLWRRGIDNVLGEANGKFKAIRQKLDSLNLKRMLPKEKKSINAKSPTTANPLFVDTSADRLAPKLGKSQFIIRVGEAKNLHNTTNLPTVPKIDLHGLTKRQALEKLESSLPEWVKMAMEGRHPFVVQVTIICGTGSQVLAEVVQGWIRKKKNVANAPKIRSV